MDFVWSLVTEETMGSFTLISVSFLGSFFSRRLRSHNNASLSLEQFERLMLELEGSYWVHVMILCISFNSMTQLYEATQGWIAGYILGTYKLSTCMACNARHWRPNQCTLYILDVCVTHFGNNDQDKFQYISKVFKTRWQRMVNIKYDERKLLDVTIYYTDHNKQDVYPVTQ